MTFGRLPGFRAFWRGPIDSRNEPRGTIGERP